MALPKAPVAAVPEGMTATGAARSTWQPDIVAWAATWRGIVAVAMFIGWAVGTLSPATHLLIFGLTVYAALTALGAGRHWRRTTYWPILCVDLAICLALLALAPGIAAAVIVALYACSTVLPWGAAQPVWAFPPCMAIGATFIIAMTLRGTLVNQPLLVTSNIALFAFFALSTAGFFTVANRLGALEIASEISRERGRYRRDLHDRLGQALCGLHFELQAVHACGLDDGAVQRLGSLADGYRDAQAMLRDLIQNAEDPIVAADVVALIRQEAQRTSDQSGVRVLVSSEGNANDVPAWMRPHIWSIAGECTTNALKNGHASNVDIDLSITDEFAVLSVVDDGVGFACEAGELPQKPGHYGLAEMRERARLCGGEVVVASAPGMGTRVRLQVPLEARKQRIEVLERDASELRRDVWMLFWTLRAALATVCAVQLGALIHGAGHPVLTAVLCGLVVLDIVLSSIRPRAIFNAFGRRPILALLMIVAYIALAIVALAIHVTPTFLLYAPLILLAIGVNCGRRRSAALSVVTIVGYVGMLLLAQVAGWLPGAGAVMLDFVAIAAIVGTRATQAATLLDRLETLQIRLRYQALARLRHGVSTRMRVELIEGLDKLERTTRTLAGSNPSPEDFAAQTEVLTAGSTEVKARLRAIVHQLADPPAPTTGRTPLHV